MGVDAAGGGFRLLALATAVGAWVLVALGGVVRVTGSGLGCPHWPLCTSSAIPLHSRESALEYSHRAVVAVVIVLVVWLAVWAWRDYRERPDVLWPALAAAALVPVQAVLGAVAIWLELAGWSVALHFVIGMLFLAAPVVVAAAASRSDVPPATRAFARLAWSTALVALALVSVGAVVVARGAATACGTQWPACNGGFASGGSSASLQVAHRMLAYTVAALCVALLVAAWRGHALRRAAAVPLGAVLVQIGFGIGVVLAGGHVRAYQILAGLHVGGAGLVWAAVLGLAVLTGASQRREPRPAKERRTQQLRRA